jgi:hypothetical protein
MRTITTLLFAMTLVTGAFVVGAQETQEMQEPPEMPEMPAPQQEHQWLQQFVGEWEYDGEIVMTPGEPPAKCAGTETVRSIGGFWIVAESTGTFMDESMTGVFTLGYSPDKDKYIGTWLSSMDSYLWSYEGTRDETGNVLTLTRKVRVRRSPVSFRRSRKRWRSSTRITGFSPQHGWAKTASGPQWPPCTIGASSPLS